MKKLLLCLMMMCILIAGISAFAVRDKKKDTMIEKNITSYVSYENGIIGKLVKSGKSVVLFFHADRCPTCVSLDKDIQNNLKTIPNDVVIVKANYDTAKNLKKLYKVKSQNALVVVNKKGKISARSKGSTTTLKDLLKLVK